MVAKSLYGSWIKIWLETGIKKASHRCKALDLSGSPTWARTRDLRINSPSLYQLSYQGIEWVAILSMHGSLVNTSGKIITSIGDIDSGCGKISRLSLQPCYY